MECNLIRPGNKTRYYMLDKANNLTSVYIIMCVCFVLFFGVCVCVCVCLFVHRFPLLQRLFSGNIIV